MVEEVTSKHDPSTLKSNIGLIGTGRFGSALAKKLVSSGHAVRASNSGGRNTLSEFAKRTGASPVPVGEVGQGVDFLILALPLGQAGKVSASVLAMLREDAIVIDASNYVPYNDGIIAEIEEGMPETTWVASQLQIPVVKAFNTIFDNSLEHFGKPAGTKGRIALPVSGDEAKSRQSVMSLIESLGFDAYDAGPLSDSWRLQIGQSCWCADPTKAELDILLPRADHKTVKQKRDTSMKMAKKVPPAFPRLDLVRVSRLMAGLERFNPAAYLSLLRLLAAVVFGSSS